MPRVQGSLEHQLHCKMSQLFFKVTSEGGTKATDASQTKAALSLKIKKVQG